VQEDIGMQSIGDTLNNGLVEGLLPIIQGDVSDPAKVEAAVRTLAARQAALAEAELQRRIEALKQEMSPPALVEDTPYTRSARPTVIYAGLLFIGVVHVVVPVVAYFAWRQPAGIELPEGFWWAWGTVVTGIVAGRSYEKVNKPNGASKILTGSR